MAYQVDKFNGTFLTSVADGTIDTTTDLRFVGKNYAGYGEVQNENFLHILENFANTTAPPKAIEGQVWYDSGNKKLKFYDGTKFKSASGAEISATAPGGLGIGDFWWDTSAKQMYAYDGGSFVLIGPEASPDLGTSGVVAQVVKDSGNANHSILKVLAGGKTVAIASQTAFTLNSSVNPIDDFTAIKKGLTLANTDANGISANDYVYWGTSSNALRLGGLQASDYITKGTVNFTSTVFYNDPGLKIGDQRDLHIFVNSADEPRINSLLGNPIDLVVTDGGVDYKTAQVTLSSLRPGTSATFDLGESTYKWKDIYAQTITANLTGNVTGNITGTVTGNVIANDTQVMINASTKEIGYAGAQLKGTLVGNVSGNVTGTASNANNLNNIAPSIAIPSPLTPTIPVRDVNGDITANQFVGIADNADKLAVDGTYRVADTDPVASTVAARDSSGNLEAVLFEGTATSARYADLAEKYLTDKNYEDGTVVSVGGAQEVTAAKEGDRALGVISPSPAYMMNAHLAGGQFVALKGRLQVNVIGAVNKGDRLVATDDGCAKASASSADVFGIALESSTEVGVKKVEAVVL
tara:strand:- start:21637 stop:23379 length:1743 start_codon:yes stop_codon:yes gene_type:complete